MRAGAVPHGLLSNNREAADLIQVKLENKSCGVVLNNEMETATLDKTENIHRKKCGGRGMGSGCTFQQR